MNSLFSQPGLTHFYPNSQHNKGWSSKTIGSLLPLNFLRLTPWVYFQVSVEAMFLGIISPDQSWASCSSAVHCITICFYIDSVTAQGFSLLCPLHISRHFWPHGFDVSLQTSTQAAALSESRIRPLNQERERLWTSYAHSEGRHQSKSASPFPPFIYTLENPIRAKPGTLLIFQPFNTYNRVSGHEFKHTHTLMHVHKMNTHTSSFFLISFKDFGTWGVPVDLVAKRMTKSRSDTVLQQAL